MNDDEIVFGEMSYREPARLAPPDRDPEVAALAYGVPVPEDPAIYLDIKAAEAIERHAASDTSVELGGILLGKECIDIHTGKPFVWIVERIEAKHYENTQASFTYTHDSWEEINRERDANHPDLDIVGWYHTHPDFGIFLSGHDEFIHRHFFNQPLQTAYVVDPVRGKRGFFRWRDGRLASVSGFWVVANRRDRVAAARFVNELEDLPSTSGEAGEIRLSPRLEAELIAMISRPNVPAAGERAQSAAIFTVLGAFAGALMVMIVFWLNSLSQNSVEQTKKLADMSEYLHKETTNHSAALELLISRAGVDEPKAFLKDLDRAIHDRDEYKNKLDERSKQLNAIANRIADLDRERLDLQGRLAKVEPELDRLKEEELERKRAEKAETSKDPAARLANRYAYVWYAAIVGWGAAVALAATLANTMFKLRSGDKPYGT